MGDIFDRVFRNQNPNTAGYTFVTDGVAISGTELPVEYDGGRFMVTQSSGNTTWRAIASSQEAAILKIIAMRLGFKVEEQ